MSTTTMNGSTVSDNTTNGAKSSTSTVNAWTEWGKLEEIVIGRAENSCFPPMEPNFVGIVNGKFVDKSQWPEGRKKESVINAAVAELSHFQETLEGEGIKVRRPAPVDHHTVTQSPTWSVSSQYGTTCPRDCMITIGNCVLESTMSKRSRFFEYLPYRHITRDLWRSDPNMKWKSAPKASFDDDSFIPDYWSWEKPTKTYSLTEKEPIFEAADMIKCGKHFFIMESISTNQMGIEWLRREFTDVVFNELHFKDDWPNHIDASCIPLRPPTDGEGGLVLVNPVRPMRREEAEMWTSNGWKFLTCPYPADIPVPTHSQCSKWLAMNILSLSDKSVVIEDNEVELRNLLDSNGFDVITVPFRNVYEFGGSLHCATWDVRRDDACIDYFPN